MTQGNILSQLISFAFPLLIGNLFQQLYNTVDTWVVGNFVGDNAFAAVGSMGPIVNMFIGFFLRLLVLIDMNERQLLAKDVKKKFAPMIELTDTLWEYNFAQRNGSYDHGFSSFAAIAAWIADQT